jgi:hypothetical protein
MADSARKFCQQKENILNEKYKDKMKQEEMLTIIIYLLFNEQTSYCKSIMNDWNILKTKNSVVLVRKRTIYTERPPLVSEVNANFCG